MGGQDGPPSVASAKDGAGEGNRTLVGITLFRGVDYQCFTHFLIINLDLAILTFILTCENGESHQTSKIPILDGVLH